VITSGGNRNPAKLDVGAGNRTRQERINTACPSRPSADATVPELVPAACHVTERYGNNPIESDHGRLKSRLRAMRGLKQLRCARVITAGHAFIQNIHRGHYELGAEETANLRILAAFDELALVI
jgi:IS6 family transposase